jgi:hypothetical protein
MTLIELIDGKTAHQVLSLDPNYEGACPCATVIASDGYLHIHCWRTCDLCSLAGVHFRGISRLAALRLTALIRRDWPADWQVVDENKIVTPQA